MLKHLVYALVDPRTGEPRYVGRSSSGLSRPRKHSTPKALANDPTYKGNWLRQLRAQGRRCSIVVLLSAHSSDCLDEAERFWIAELRRRGHRLTNLTEGGEGTVGRKLSAEAKAKIGAAHKGKVVSADTRQLLREARQGQEFSAETLAKLSTAARGRASWCKDKTLSDETRRRMSDAHKGRSPSPEHRARLSQARIAYWANKRAARP